MMDKKSEMLNQAVQEKDDLIAKLQQQLADAKKARATKSKDYYTHQVSEMGDTTQKFLIDPDLLTKEDLDDLLNFAFSKPDVQARLKEKLRSHGWVEEAENDTDPDSDLLAKLFGDGAGVADGER